MPNWNKEDIVDLNMEKMLIFRELDKTQNRKIHRMDN